MVEAIAQELIIQKKYLNQQPLKTIYFGGGTPSLLSAAELELIMETIRDHYPTETNMDITLEANPDDLSLERLTQFKNAGVNRLSIGIQTFDDTVLTFLNRAHHAAMAIETFHLARNVGFENISIDLIFAIPGQGDEDWKKNIQQALALSPNHISAYSLTIEEKTVFGKRAQRGLFTKVSEDVAANQMETLVELLGKGGYQQYEVSNFCQPNFEAVHNTNYWRQQHYLGVGPSAHSFNGVSRQFNISNNAQYVRSIYNGTIPFDREVLSREDKVNEYLLTGLRTVWGCDLKKLHADYQYNLLQTQEPYVNTLLDKGLATLSSDQRLRLTTSGFLLADKIASDLFLIL